MRTERFHASWVVAATIAIALTLSVVPLSAGIRPFWPHWAVLVVLYWCMALPSRIGIGIAWIVGLLLDVLYGSILGEHALAFALVAFLLLKTHTQVRVFPLLQQTLAVAALIISYEFIVFWIDGMVGLPSDPLVRWMPTVTSALVWPLILGLLRYLRRKYKVA